jgi:glyoxylase-like metal-dependent hydrolase (beta-lactamase superfamily II)
MATALAASLAASLAVGCVASPIDGVGVASATAGPGDSMFSAFQTDGGVILIDLGWWGAQHRLRGELEGVGAGPEDVIAVFLTHAHRDHIAAWPLVRHATFHLAAAEAPYFFGEREYEGWIPRAADRIAEPSLPVRGEVAVTTFDSDTSFVVGRDTVRAFLVPGHTAGSTAYLVRGVLFAGDALAHTQLGFRPALPGFSDDVDQAAESLRSLFQRVRPFEPRFVCTAHAKCARFDDAFVRDVLGDARPVTR